MWLNRKFYALLARVIALLGFVSVSSCEQALMYGPAPCMYGPMPERTNNGCRLEASVTDEQGNGIEGIRLTVRNLGSNVVMDYEPVYTDADGKVVVLYKVPRGYEYDDFVSGTVLAEDIDGAENGGEFESVEVEFSNEGAEIQSNAYQKELQIVMKRKD